MSKIDFDYLYLQSLKNKQSRDDFFTKSIELVQRLVRTYININCAKKYYSFEFEDLVQYGCIGLIKAYDAFDQNRGKSWTSFVSACIIYEIK